MADHPECLGELALAPETRLEAGEALSYESRVLTLCKAFQRRER